MLMDREMTRPMGDFTWLESVVWDSFCWLDGIRPVKTRFRNFTEVYFWNIWRKKYLGNRLTQVYLKNGHSNEFMKWQL